jgi:hypothetical protein
MEHISQDRLVELAIEPGQSSREEDEHVEICSECFGKLVELVHKLGKD